MTTAATSLLGLALPVTGELSGTWGDTVNNSITSLLDTAIAGTTTLSTDADVTLTTTTLASNQARQAILLCSGARTGIKTITAPAQSKIYTVINSTTGGYAVKIVGVGPTTGVTIGSGQSAQVAWNGSDFVQVGASAGGSNTQVQYNNSGALAGSANLTFNGTTLTANALTVTNATTLSAGTANGVAYLNGSKVLTTGSALTFNASTLAIATAANDQLTWTAGRTGYLYADSAGVAIGDTALLAGNNTYYNKTSNYIANYINGSEQMRLTSTGLGIGTSSPAYKLDAQTTATGTAAGDNTVGYFGSLASGRDANIRFGDSVNASARIGYLSGALYMYTSGAERMRLDTSGNLGIGTSSPSAKLHVVSGAVEPLRLGSTTSGYNYITHLNVSSGVVGYLGDGLSAVTGYAATDYAIRANQGNLLFATNGNNVRAIIDSSGNLGLGVTPSAWYSNRKAIQVSNGVTISGSLSSADYGFIGTNYYDNASAVATYIGSGKAAKYEQSAGVHAWYTAASGTAGNTISFTQAMTLDASGNLGIGTTSPTFAAGGGLQIKNSTFASCRISHSSYTGLDVSQASDGKGYLWNRDNADILFGTNNTERARIDSSGNLLVGTTTSSQKLTVAGGIAVTANSGTVNPTYGVLGLYTGGGISTTYLQMGTGGSIDFWKPDTSVAARIDANGAITQTCTSSANSLKTTNSNGSPNGLWVQYSSAAPNGTGNEGFYFSDSGALRASIRSNGGLANYSGNNVNLSDRREKTNFAPAGDYLAKICAIPVQTFNYIDQNMGDDPGLTLGVVAQDVEAVAPELVMESNWAKEGEEPKMRLSIYQTDLQYALMKCIQELKAELDAAKAEIATLKGN